MTAEDTKRIAQLELDLANMEDERNQLQPKADEFQKQVTLGLLGILIGLILLVVFWPLGILLTIAGFFAYLNNADKRNKTKKQLAELNEQLPKMRKELAELKIANA